MIILQFLKYQITLSNLFKFILGAQKKKLKYKLLKKAKQKQCLKRKIVCTSKY